MRKQFLLFKTNYSPCWRNSKEILPEELPAGMLLMREMQHFIDLVSGATECVWRKIRFCEPRWRFYSRKCWFKKVWDHVLFLHYWVRRRITAGRQQ